MELDSSDRATQDDLRAAYRLLLEREPDPAGLQFNSNFIANGISLGDLRARFMASDEYQNATELRPNTIDMGAGLFVSINPKDPEFGRFIAVHRTWEPHLVEQIVSSLGPDGVYVDVGANVGIMSFNAARRVGPGGKVIAFEPDRENAARFVEGLAANAFHNVVLHQFALSSEAGVVSLAGGSNAFVTKRQTNRLVQAIRGDTILANEYRIDFIKMDIEGFEPFALRGLDTTLKRHHPTVLCEFNPSCLKHTEVNHEQFAEQIFNITSKIIVIEHNNMRTAVDNSSSLVDMWKSKNDEAVRTNLLPDGMLHFDLLFTAG